MKEATGELNMTVITIAAIAVVAALFYAILWPTIQENMALNTACNAAGYNDYTTTGTISGEAYTIACSKGQCTYSGGNKSASRNCGV